LQRLVVPPPIHQFRSTLDKNAATELFTLLNNHRPETKKEKKLRLGDLAKKHEPQADSEKPCVVKYGLRHITGLIEQKKAKLVLIAHDVDPIELVVWLPTLCRKKGIPYAIVKGKARLGKVVHKKTASCLAFVNVLAKDKTSFNNLVKVCKETFNDRYADTMKQEGGSTLSRKTLQRRAKVERQRRAEEKKQERK